MSPFRLFGHPPGSDATTSPDADTGAAVTWAAGPWSADPAPATRHARPVRFPGAGGAACADDDPPTDPHGFPPVPGEAVAPPRCTPPPAPDPLAAAALAAAFAADYLSWDEDDPARRGRALADHLAAPACDPTLLGWDGRGRQRAEFALPGQVRSDGDDRVLVDVRVRVTPYREVGDRAAGRAAGGAAEAEPHVAGTPASASAPSCRGWRSGASSWVRLSVPVVHEDGRLVVDAAEESPELSGSAPAGGAHARPGGTVPAGGNLLAMPGRTW